VSATFGRSRPVPQDTLQRLNEASSAFVVDQPLQRAEQPAESVEPGK